MTHGMLFSQADATITTRHKTITAKISLQQPSSHDQRAAELMQKVSAASRNCYPK